MMVAMATDVRVILIKLADRLHNMRTLGALPKQKQHREGARDARDLRAARPPARDPRDQVGAGGPRLRDAAPAQVRRDQAARRPAARRARALRRRGRAASSPRSWSKVGIEAEISGRAKHFYSIYTKMTKKGREFNEIFDLTAMRVIVGSVKDCYGAIGVIHSLWKPLPGPLQGLRRDAQGEHVPGAAHDGDRPRGQAARDPDPHRRRCTSSPSTGSPPTSSTRRATRRATRGKEKMTWLRQLVEAEGEQDPAEFLESLKVDLFEDEVFVFTPKGEVKNLSAGSTPLDFAYAIHTDVGHRCVGAKVNGKIVPLHYQLQLGRHRRGADRQAGARALARLAQAGADQPRPQQDPRLVHARSGARTPSTRAARQLAEALRKRGLPTQKLAGSPLLADVIREMGFRKADDFYIALGQGKISTKIVANKVMQRLKRGRGGRGGAGRGPDQGRRDDARAPHQGGLQLRDQGQGRRQRRGAARQVLPPGARRRDRRLRLARPRDHDPPRPTAATCRR